MIWKNVQGDKVKSKSSCQKIKRHFNQYQQPKNECMCTKMRRHSPQLFYHCKHLFTLLFDCMCLLGL